MPCTRQIRVGRVARSVRIVGDCMLQVRAVRNFGVCRPIPRIRSVLEPGEDRLHDLLNADQRHVSPKRAAEFLVPEERRLLRGERVRVAAKEFPIEHAVRIRVGDHEMADPQVFAGALLEQRLRRVVPLPVAVVRMDVIFSGVPAVRGLIGPTLEVHFDRGDLSGGDEKAAPRDAVFRPPKNAERVFAGREIQFGGSGAVKVPIAMIFNDAIKRTRRRMEFSGIIPKRDAGGDGLLGAPIAKAQSQRPR